MCQDVPTKPAEECKGDGTATNSEALCTEGSHIKSRMELRLTTLPGASLHEAMLSAHNDCFVQKLYRVPRNYKWQPHQAVLSTPASSWSGL
jgi:organic hydroperoxide reductase OsmC/OhrA